MERVLQILCLRKKRQMVALMTRKCPKSLAVAWLPLLLVGRAAPAARVSLLLTPGCVCGT